MRKIMLAGLVLAVGMLGTLRSAYCASDPGTQSGRFSIGVVQEYIFDRDMEGGEVSMPPNLESGNELMPPGVNNVTSEMKVKDLGMTLLKVGYQVSNNLNVYAKLGVTNGIGGFDMASSGTWAGGTFTEKEAYKEKSAFAGGLGLKLTLPLKNNWIIGVDAQYLAHQNDYSGKWSARFADSAGNLLPGLSINQSRNNWGSTTISEWHVAPFVAKNFGKFVPYIGIKYSDMKIDMLENSDRLQATDNWGAFVGADFKFNKNFSLNLEGRFIDENAASLAANFTF